MKTLHFSKIFLLATICFSFSILSSTNANAQWATDNANDYQTTYDRVRIIGPESTALNNFNGAKLFVQNPSVSANNALRVWQERENHSAVQIGTNGYGLKISSTTTTPNSRWLMHMDHNGDEIFTVKADGRVGIGGAFPSGKFQVVHGGSTKFIVQEDGRVGIGTSTPGARLNILNANNTNIPALLLQQQETGNSSINVLTNGYGVFVKAYHNNGKYLLCLRNKSNHNVLYARADGKVGIGVNNIPDGYKLGVDGKIIAEEIKVKLSQNWPDYVFTPEHQKPTLEELEASIKTNGHLPNIPSAEEVESDGYLIGEMDVKLLEKIEELTLYVIDLNKEMKAVKAKNQELEASLQTIGN